MGLITVAIHTFPHATALKQTLEREGIAVTLQNVNLQAPGPSAGVRVRIAEADLPLALRIIEHPEIFAPAPQAAAAGIGGRPCVMLPVSLDDVNEGAVATAFNVAAAHGAAVAVVHAYAEPSLLGAAALSRSLTFGSTGDDTASANAAKAKAERAMDTFAGRLRLLIKEGAVEAAPFATYCREGLPEDVINRLARDLRPLVIVMGSQSADNSRRDSMGSVTAEVLDTCRFPVITVPKIAGGAFTPAVLAKALFFAMPDQLDIAALDQMMRLLPADRQPRHVTLLNVASRKLPAAAADAMANLGAYCARQWPATAFSPMTLPQEKAPLELMRLDRESGFDVMVVPNRRRNMIARLFNPTLPHRILFHTNKPMMVVPV